jgi:hypothetical protein
MRWLCLFGVLLVALPSFAQDPASADPTPGPRIEALWAAGSPVVLTAPRLGTQDGLPFVQCLFVNDGDAPAWQVDLLFLIYDGVGRRKAAHALSLAPRDLPIEARTRRSARIPLPYVDIHDDDTVRVGLTRVGTEAAATAWVNEKVGEESDAQMDSLFAPPPLIVSSPEGAPVTISDVAVQADTEGRVVGVSLTAANPGDAPVLGFTIVAHVFDSAGRIRRAAYQTISATRALIRGLPYVVRLRIDASDLPNATVWVALESTNTPAWKNPDTPGQAKAAMERRRR